jgi:CelD/BcsL family acetyltransferase involved in cellulose biosynthesis
MVGTVKVTVVRPGELDASEEKLWREFQSSSPMTAHPCLSLDYARAVCRADESGRVAVVEDGGQICAFIPYSKGDDGIAATLGGGQTALDGLVSSSDRMDLRAVVRGAGLRGWRFSRAPVEQRPLDPYRYQGGFHAELIYFSDLRNGYDGYMRDLPRGGRNEIATAARRRRALEREVREVSFEWNSSDPSHLSLLLNWKSDQYESMRKWLLSPLNHALVRELADSDSEDYSCLTSVLYAEARPISICLSLRRGHILSQWISAFDPEYSRFSPGTLNMLAMFAEAPERGVEIADFGYGNDLYKQRFGSGVHTVTGGGVWASRLGTAARSIYRKARFHG